MGFFLHSLAKPHLFLAIESTQYNRIRTPEQRLEKRIQSRQAFFFVVFLLDIFAILPSPRAPSRRDAAASRCPRRGFMAKVLIL
jgi:hypothetical protein